MCGIVGAAGALEYRDKDALQFLMHLCELRGEDSTGYFTVGRDDAEADIHKVVGPTRYMFDTMKWDKLNTFSHRVFVGHCRKATIGKVSRTTAHPFNYGNITGVHNGTLRNWRYLLPKEEETDSMTLFKAMDEKGAREALGATDGAYALVWWNEEEETLNFVRNKERPLFWAMSKDYKRVFWASEAWMLHIALSRAGIELADLTPRDKDTTHVLPLEEDTWWRIKPGRRGDKDAITFLSDHDENLKGGVNPAKYTAPPFQGTYQRPFPVAGSGASSSQQSNVPAITPPAVASTNTSQSQSNTTTTGSTSQGQGSQASRTTLSLVQGSKSVGSEASKTGKQQLKDEKGNLVIIGLNGLMMTKAEYETWVTPNCVWCQEPTTFEELVEDNDRIGDWVDDDTFICRNCCTENKEIMGRYGLC